MAILGHKEFAEAFKDIYGSGYAVTLGTQSWATIEAAQERASWMLEEMEIAYARVFNPPPLDHYVWHDVAALIDNQ